MGLSPFQANYGFDPTIETTKATFTDAPKATVLVEKLAELQKRLQEEWIFLQNRMKHYADKSRSPAPILKEGDKVYLLRKNIKSQRPSDKLDWKKIGPFKIAKKLSNVHYKLDIPLKQHPTFHVSLLEPAPATIPVAKGVPGIELAEGHYVVERIMTSRYNKKKNRMEYLVKWKGYDDTENTWEPKEHFKKSPSLLNQYHQRGVKKDRQG